MNATLTSLMPLAYIFGAVFAGYLVGLGLRRVFPKNSIC